MVEIACQLNPLVEIDYAKKVVQWNQYTGLEDSFFGTLLSSLLPKFDDRASVSAGGPAVSGYQDASGLALLRQQFSLG